MTTGEKLQANFRAVTPGETNSSNLAQPHTRMKFLYPQILTSGVTFRSKETIVVIKLTLDKVGSFCVTSIITSLFSWFYCTTTNSIINVFIFGWVDKTWNLWLDISPPFSPSCLLCYGEVDYPGNQMRHAL